ncbi:MAG: hypothetical protein ACT4PM_08940 [Gemmatimonadales bacterium]
MRTAALLLLLLQIKPLAAAVICLDASARTECEMPAHEENGSMPDRMPADQEDFGGSVPGCFAVTICSSGTPALEARLVELPTPWWHAEAPVWFVPEGHSADPTAPPPPPPNP